MVEYMWKLDNQRKMVGLQANNGGVRHFVTDLDEYERALKLKPSIVRTYDLNNPYELKIVHGAIRKIIESPNKEREFKYQVINLGVKPTTLRDWMMMDMLKYNEPRDDIIYIDRKKKVKKAKSKRKKCRCK
jgi:hypothetical protein